MANTEDAQQLPTDDMPQQQTPFRYGWQAGKAGQQAANTVRSAIKQYTGRDATDDDIYNQHLNWDKAPDAQFMGKIVSNIANSSEAKNYQNNSQQQQTAPSAPPPPGGNGAPAAATGSPVSANGTIAPAAPMPTPATRGQEPNQTRYVQPVDLSGIHSAGPAQAPQLQLPQGDFSGGQNALMSAILANPETMNPNVVAQMKEAQKEQALLMQHQGQQQYDSSAAARGVLGGGAAQGQAANLQNQTFGNILTGNRNVDIAALGQNRQDQLNALTASQGLAGSQLANALQTHAAQLGDTQFNAGQQQQDYQNRINQALSQFGINQGVAGNAQQNYAGDLAGWQAGEGRRQFNNTLGFNYNQLNQNGQNSLLQFLIQSGLFQ